MTTPARSNEDQPRNYTAKAIKIATRLHQSGKLQEAEQLYRGILAVESDHFGALCGLGAICRQQGKADEAVSLYERAAGAGTASADLLANLGAVLAALNRPEAAVSCLEKALAANPEHGETNRNVADMLQKLGRFDAAVGYYERAIAIDPERADAHNNLGNALFALKRYNDAVTHYERALAVKPGLPGVHANIGNVLRVLGRAQEAMAHYQKALASMPDHPEVHCNLGNALQDLGRLEEAIAHYNKALAAKPDFAEAHNNLATAYKTIGRADEAIAHYERALAIVPGYADARCNLGNTLAALGRRDEAIAHYEKALVARPDFAVVHNNLGNVRHTLGQFDQAILHYRKALEIAPDYAEAHSNLACSLQMLNRPQEAIAHHERALALKPKLAEAHKRRGSAPPALGRPEEARQPVKPATEPAARKPAEPAPRTAEAAPRKPAEAAPRKPAEPAPRKPAFQLADAYLSPFVAGDPRLAEMEEMARNMGSFSVEQRSALHFALGKAYADLKRFPLSFRHLVDGNALKRRQVAYDEAATMRLFKRIEATFDYRLMEAKAGHGHPSEVPVFVLGMPRSGMTLIEQILAGHSSAFGAGERDDLKRAVATIRPPAGGLPGGGPEGFPDVVPTMSAEAMRLLGATYVSSIGAMAPMDERVVDKTPSNFLYAGLIHLALPNARIIHARRDPVDTCLSCFSILFAGDQPFSYDLGEVARYYRAYEALMDHWRSVLPLGVMLEVQFEQVVDDLEGQARRIIDYCGLEWEDGCLAFHENQRPLQTGTIQVRQPIYRSSVGRWHDYADMLQPLLRELYMGPLDYGVADSQR